MTDKNERTREEVETIIKVRDLISPSPSVRFNMVYELIRHHEHLTNWDVICFCIEYLSSQSLIYIWLKPFLRPVSRIIYNAHYYMPDQVVQLEQQLRNTPHESQGTDGAASGNSNEG